MHIYVKNVNLIYGTHHPVSSAKVVVELAKSDDIKAAVLLHPSFVTVDDIKGTDFASVYSIIVVLCCYRWVLFWYWHSNMYQAVPS